MCDMEIKLFLNYITFTINIAMLNFSFHCNIVAFKYTIFITFLIKVKMWFSFYLENGQIY